MAKMNAVPTSDRDFLIAPGAYHFSVESVKEEEGLNKSKGVMEEKVIVKCTCLAGRCQNEKDNPEEQKDKTTTEFFGTLAPGRLLDFAIAVELYTDDERKADSESGKELEIDFSKAVGRQFCAFIEHETFQGKTNPKMNFNIFHVDHEKSKDIPKDQAWYQMHLDKKNGVQQPSQRQSAPQQQPVGAGVGAGSDNFDDFE